MGSRGFVKSIHFWTPVVHDRPGKLNDGGTPSGLNDRVMLQKPAGVEVVDSVEKGGKIFEENVVKVNVKYRI